MSTNWVVSLLQEADKMWQYNGMAAIHHVDLQKLHFYILLPVVRRVAKSEGNWTFHC